ncbi:MAG: hypothetical protein GXO85_10905 [Chlorobi bacterium]|nr:hypothetical protein [Chlorobiota bacterium]
MDSLFDGSLWFDENGDEIPFEDCAVLECKNKSPFYLCLEHLDLFSDRQATFVLYAGTVIQLLNYSLQIMERKIMNSVIKNSYSVNAVENAEI